jgi:predicted nucleotidyltransferase
LRPFTLRIEGKTVGYLAQHFNQAVNIHAAKAEAERVSSRIAEVTDPNLIVLIGSLADGSFGSGSDIDLVIVYSDQQSLTAAKKLLSRAGLNPEYPVDYLMCTQERFDKQKLIGGPFFVAHNEGVVLYDKRKAL